MTHPALVELIQRLCEVSPRVRAMREEHVRDQDALVPLLFLGVDVGRHAIDLHESAKPEDLAELDALLATLEDAFARGPPEVDDAIHLGFLERLGGPLSEGWRVRERLGPRLRARIETIWPSEPGR